MPCRRLWRAQRACTSCGVHSRLTPARWLNASALAACLACVLLVPTAPGATRLPRLLGDAPHGRLTWQIRPAHILYTGDGSGRLGGFDGKGAAHPGRLRWASWTPTQATGSGAVWLDSCTPSCAQGTFTAHAVEVRAFRPVRGRFTRLTLRYGYRGKRHVDTRGIRRTGSFWSYYIVAR
jgi:hypothetical protein